MVQNLTITDKLLYCLINDYTKRKQPFTANNQSIARELGKSIETIKHSISRLIKFGYIYNNGGKFSRELFTVKNLTDIVKNPILGSVKKYTLESVKKGTFSKVSKKALSQNKNSTFSQNLANESVKNDLLESVKNDTFSDFNLLESVKKVSKFLESVKNDTFSTKYETMYLLYIINNIINIYHSIHHSNIIYLYIYLSYLLPKEKEEEKERVIRSKELESESRKEGEKAIENNINPPLNSNKNQTVENRILDWWNEDIVPVFNLAKLFKINGIRRDDLMARIYDCGGEEKFKTILNEALVDLQVYGDDFMFGENKKKWKMTFDWIMQPKNFNALVERKYLKNFQKRDIIGTDKQKKGE